MLWLVPHLFVDARLLDVATPGLRLPGLQTLLARGIVMPREPAIGTEAAVCRALGIAQQRDWPLAPMTLEMDGGTAGDDYWLRADPVHLHVMRDRIALVEPRLDDLAHEEALALAHAVRTHFGEACDPIVADARRWYLRLARPLRLDTTPPSLAAGRAIEATLPRGEDAAHLKALLNELQMLLHTHPVNQAREARGALPVNSLWPWGGGTLPIRPADAPPIYAHQTDCRAAAAWCGALCEIPPNRFDTGMPASGVVLLDALETPARTGDALGWREALRQLECDWFVPLARGLNRLGPADLHLLDPVHGRSVLLRSADAWKVWRRPRPLSVLSG